MHCIDPKYRGKGIAKEVLDLIIDYCKMEYYYYYYLLRL